MSKTTYLENPIMAFIFLLTFIYSDSKKKMESTLVFMEMNLVFKQIIKLYKMDFIVYLNETVNILIET